MWGVVVEEVEDVWGIVVEVGNVCVGVVVDVVGVDDVGVIVVNVC